MSYGLAGIASNYYSNMYQQNKVTGQKEIGNFGDVLVAKGIVDSFGEMLKAKYPQMQIHQIDASKIPSGIWNRTDFPFEKFFDENVDYNEVLNWKPSGAEPKMSSAECQSRYQSTFGKMSVLVPPALQEKMDNDPQLAQKVARTVDSFIEQSQRPPRAVSVLISLNEDGEIANWTTCTEGGFMGPSEEELRAIEERKREKQEEREEYRRQMQKISLERAQEQRENYELFIEHKVAHTEVEKRYEAHFSLMQETGSIQYLT